MKKGFQFKEDLLEATARREENFSSKMRHWNHIRKTMDEATKISSDIAAGLKSHNILGFPVDPDEETYHECKIKSLLKKEIDKVINGITPDNKYLWLGFTDKENPHKFGIFGTFY